MTSKGGSPTQSPDYKTMLAENLDGRRKRTVQPFNAYMHSTPSQRAPEKRTRPALKRKNVSEDKVQSTRPRKVSRTTSKSSLPASNADAAEPTTLWPSEVPRSMLSTFRVMISPFQAYDSEPTTTTPSQPTTLYPAKGPEPMFDHSWRIAFMGSSSLPEDTHATTIPQSPEPAVCALNHSNVSRSPLLYSQSYNGPLLHHIPTRHSLPTGSELHPINVDGHREVSNVQAPSLGPPPLYRTQSSASLQPPACDEPGVVTTGDRVTEEMHIQDESGSVIPPEAHQTCKPKPSRLSAHPISLASHVHNELHPIALGPIVMLDGQPMTRPESYSSSSHDASFGHLYNPSITTQSNHLNSEVYPLHSRIAPPSDRRSGSQPNGQHPTYAPIPYFPLSYAPHILVSAPAPPASAPAPYAFTATMPNPVPIPYPAYLSSFPAPPHSPAGTTSTTPPWCALYDTLKSGPIQAYRTAPKTKQQRPKRGVTPEDSASAYVGSRSDPEDLRANAGSAEEAHPCPFCPRVFTLPNSLTLHLKWHWGASALDWKKGINKNGKGIERALQEAAKRREQMDKLQSELEQAFLGGASAMDDGSEPLANAGSSHAATNDPLSMPIIAQSSSDGFFSFGVGPVNHFQSQSGDTVAASEPAGLEVPYTYPPSMSVLTSPFNFDSGTAYTSESSTGGSVPRTPELSAGSTSSNGASVGAGSPTWSQDLFGCDESKDNADDLFGDGDGYDGDDGVGTFYGGPPVGGAFDGDGHAESC
ncbi:hypothetical protein C8Q80DRAFT_368295 [Daedaleopsis nitida]|nr:hypothetical protein C8Q80DRAFT_368295 [Daedaleopsis nitida]